MKYALRSARSRTSGCTADAYAPSVLWAFGSSFIGPYRDVCPQGGRSGCSAGSVRRSRPFPNQIPRQRHAVRSRRASMAARALKWHEVAELRPTASRLV
jgi:hypothetical protein